MGAADPMLELLAIHARDKIAVSATAQRLSSHPLS
jgi:hypothetical protein